MGNRILAIALTVLTISTAGCTSHVAPTRDLVLVARGMSFVLEGGADLPNPRIQLRAGERVHLVLKNEAPGLLHDLVIPDLDVAIAQTRAGESRDVTFVVPDTPGRFAYRCQPHSGMMSGFVEVTR